jgi:hypothetical protein
MLVCLWTWLTMSDALNAHHIEGLAINVYIVQIQ